MDTAHPETIFDVVSNPISSNLVQRIANLHLECLVTFLNPKPHHAGQYQAIGTGFFVVWPEDNLFLRIVTAAHVLDVFDFANGRITIGKVSLVPGDVGQKNFDRNLDIATWAISASHLGSAGIKNVPGLRLYPSEIAKECFVPTNSFVVMGYPASKNKVVDFRRGNEPDRHIAAVAFHGLAKPYEAGAICFNYTREAVPEAWASDHTTPVHLSGMSGSPCLRFVVARGSDGVGLVPSGVLIEWDKTRQLVTSSWFGDPWLPAP